MRADIYKGPKKEGGITTTVALRPTGSGEIERDKSWRTRMVGGMEGTQRKLTGDAG